MGIFYHLRTGFTVLCGIFVNTYMVDIFIAFDLIFAIRSFQPYNGCNKKPFLYQLKVLNFFVYIKSCQYSMFYSNKMF